MSIATGRLRGLLPGCSLSSPRVRFRMHEQRS